MSATHDDSMDTLTPRVLVVDDEDAIRELLDYGLSHAGFNVRSVPTGEKRSRRSMIGRPRRSFWTSCCPKSTDTRCFQ
jgi:hypothetical protein